MKALNAAPSEGSEKLAAGYVYLSRLARILVARGKLKDAANASKEAFDFESQVTMPAAASKSRRGARAYAMLKVLDPSYYTRNEEELQTFLEMLRKAFAEEAQVLGWVTYWESEILFGKLAVQAAKRRLIEAQELSRQVDDCDLLWAVAREKLFYRVGQFYLNHDDWIRDAIDTALMLRKDNCQHNNRDEFADHVDRFSHAQSKPPLSEAAATIDAHKGHWASRSFQVVSYALWRTAKARFVLTGKLGDIETYLKQSATFLTSLEFPTGNG